MDVYILAGYSVDGCHEAGQRGHTKLKKGHRNQRGCPFKCHKMQDEGRKGRCLVDKKGFIEQNGGQGNTNTEQGHTNETDQTWDGTKHQVLWTRDQRDKRQTSTVTREQERERDKLRTPQNPWNMDPPEPIHQ